MSRRTKPTAQIEHREIRFQQSMFSGPLPQPEALARYNEVVPNAAERIISMAESQQRHRQQLEANVVQANIASQSLGVKLGFIIAMTAIIGGIYLAATGRSVSGLTTIVGALSALVGVFVYGKQSQKKELIAKRPS